MEYNFSTIEPKWQQYWNDTNAYRVPNNSPKPKYYVLDMFPYPSGAGLHVGHPLGYIASDIYSRYKRLKGFNVLHPMGYDAFGLPAEQYAIEHGVHPAVSTKKNIETFRSQLDKIGFCFDWEREVRTSEPDYYKHTQWIFLQLFNSFFNRQTQKAEPIAELIAVFEKEGNTQFEIPNNKFQIPGFSSRSNESFVFSAEDWKSFDEATQQTILMEYRLAYCGYGEVNWCEALGTVLANDEVVNGVSERGGHPVVKKKLRQWYLRITEYADRLLQGLETIDFSDAMKEMQTNWIGKSYGAEIDFNVKSETGKVNSMRVYTTRPDTIFGVDFMVIAPELDWVADVVSEEQKTEVEAYLAYVNARSDRERQAEKKISGCFTGAYAINPFDGREIPIWISEYVLAGYGTGAIMGVPCGDERDHKFAQHFNIPITNIIGDAYNGQDANATKDAILQNSGFLNGMVMREASDVVINELEKMSIGKRKVNYKMRDAAFSRQRYWGEPFPIVWKNGVAYALDESELPLELPEVESYSPGPEGEGPLANIKEWALIPGPSPEEKDNLIPGPSPEEKGAQAQAGSQNDREDEKDFNDIAFSILSPFQYDLAKDLRKNHTQAEKKLWEELRDRKLGVELKFRRQHSIDAYIVDFICIPKRLVVEVDGGYHENEEQKVYDEERTKRLNELGFDVIRFTNDEVINNIKQVLKTITLKTVEFDKQKATAELNQQTKKEAPLSSGEGTGVRETNTMPGYAGSSWYFLRYMDPHNPTEFASRQATDYWNQVDLYVGGTEHAVGHLLYSRMWTKALYDLGHIGFDEPFKKLLNQGMIQGSSRFVYRITGTNTYISKDLLDTNDAYNGQITDKLHVDVNLVDGILLDTEAFKNWKPEFADAEFILSDGKGNVVQINYESGGGAPLSPGEGMGVRCSAEVEKMSKSKFNTVNPDDLVAKYGADTFRMYEMFLGPVEVSKPWDTKGIEGVHRFIKKLWRLFYDDVKGLIVTNMAPTPAELKILHKTIKKIEEDTERFSFNTAVSAFMIAVNDLTDLKCHKVDILYPLIVMLTPYAPHISEELFNALKTSAVGKGITGETVLDASFPVFIPAHVAESSKEYPVSINGRVRTNMSFDLDAEQATVQEAVLANELVQKWMEGKPLKKMIYVKGKMINVVV
jgi:leucyl-tRNA synthetase